MTASTETNRLTSASRNGHSGGLPQAMAHTLPHSVEAEMGVLGSMMISPRLAILETMERLTAEHFYMPAHMTIYAELVSAFEEGQASDLITFTQRLRDKNLLDFVGGAVAVTALFSFVPTAAMLEHYVEIVRDKFTLRQLIATATEIVRRGFEEQDQIRELVDDAQAKITAVALDQATESPVKHIMPSVEAALAEIENARKLRATVTGLATGFVDLDRTTLGLNDGDFIVIGGRPSMGKTSFAMQIAQNIATPREVMIKGERVMLPGKPVLIFSIETSAQRLMLRAICARARANIQNVRRGEGTDAKFEELKTAAGEIGPSPIYINESAALRTYEFKAQCRQSVRLYGVRLIIIDYIQLMRSPSKRAELSKQVEMADVSVTVKEIARELNVPIIALAQLKREVENRRDAKPRMSDLKESGQFEQDADLIGFLHRDDYYLPEGSEEREAAAGRAVLMIAKQKDGPTGEIPLAFEAEFARFENAPAADGTPRPFFALYSNNRALHQPKQGELRR